MLQVILPAPTETTPVAMQLRPLLSDEDFFHLCQRNKELRIERTAKGEIIIMSPVGWESSNRNAILSALLFNWARVDGTGKVADSSGGFILPNGATRSPDAAWGSLSRLTTISPAERKRFLPLAPDFVIELRSESDRLAELQEKMEEYRDNGVRLGWLIDPQGKQVFVYRPGQATHHLQTPTTLSGNPELANFELDLQDIWDTNEPFVSPKPSEPR